MFHYKMKWMYTFTSSAPINQRDGKVSECLICLTRPESIAWYVVQLCKKKRSQRRIMDERIEWMNNLWNNKLIWFFFYWINEILMT